MKIMMFEMFRTTPQQSLRSLARRAISTALVGVFTTCSIASAAGARLSPQTGPDKASTLKEQVQAIPPNTLVQVKLRSKKKINGRLGEITDQGFAIQTVGPDKSENEKISFDDVKSIKSIQGRDKASKVAAYIVVGAAAGVVLSLILVGALIGH